MIFLLTLPFSALFKSKLWISKELLEFDYFTHDIYFTVNNYLVGMNKKKTFTLEKWGTKLTKLYGSIQGMASFFFFVFFKCNDNLRRFNWVVIRVLIKLCFVSHPTKIFVHKEPSNGTTLNQKTFEVKPPRHKSFKYIGRLELFVVFLHYGSQKFCIPLGIKGFMIRLTTFLLLPVFVTFFLVTLGDLLVDVNPNLELLLLLKSLRVFTKLLLKPWGLRSILLNVCPIS